MQRTKSLQERVVQHDKENFHGQDVWIHSCNNVTQMRQTAEDKVLLVFSMSGDSVEEHIRMVCLHALQCI